MKAFFVLIGVLASGVCCAADSVVVLRTIEVVGRRYREVIPAQTLRGEELKAMSNLSVSDALRYFSGVQIKDYGGVAGLKTVNVRSLGSQHIGVFYNGVQLGNAQNGQVDLGKFSLDNIEEITLYNGQRSEVFQSAREYGSAGSIYITTRRPTFQANKEHNLKAKLKTGSFGLLNPSALVELKLNDNLSASLNTEWTKSNGRYRFRYMRRLPSGGIAYDTTAVRHNGDINATRIEAGLFGSVAPQTIFNSNRGGTWQVQAYHYDSERGIPGAIVNNVWKTGERLWDKNSFLQGRMQFSATNTIDIKAMYKYAYDYTHYLNDSEQARIDNEYKQQEHYATLAMLYKPSPIVQLSLATDYINNQLSGNSPYALSPSTLVAGETAPIRMEAVSGDTQPQRNTYMAAVAGSLTLPCRLKMQATLLGTLVKEELSDKTSKHTTPAFFTSYKPFANIDLTLRAFAKQSLRMPTFNDLYYTDGAFSANLRPERTTQYNVGVAYSLPFVSVTCDAYYNRVHDKLIAYPRGAQFRWAMLNLGEVEVKGLDVMLAAQAAFLQCKLQYTYNKAIDITNSTDTYYRNQIPFTPEHSGSATVTAAWDHFIATYSFLYSGVRYSAQENNIYNKVQPWYTSDMSLTYRMAHASLTAEICNLFSQDYDVVPNYPMPKRNYRLTLTYEL